jgi:hypothetical protein
MRERNSGEEALMTLLDSALQGFLETDGGELLARKESLAALKRMFGKNEG